MASNDESAAESGRAISQAQARKERGLLEHDYSSPCAECGGVVFEWEDSNTCPECDDTDDDRETEQTTLVTDGGTDSPTIPPHIDPNTDVVECHFCGRRWNPTVVDGFDLSPEDEYYPDMVPVCPEHAEGCR